MRWNPDETVLWANAVKLTLDIDHKNSILYSSLVLYLCTLRLFLSLLNVSARSSLVCCSPSWSIKVSIAAPKFATSILQTIRVGIQPESSGWLLPSVRPNCIFCWQVGIYIYSLHLINASLTTRHLRDQNLWILFFIITGELHETKRER